MQEINNNSYIKTIIDNSLPYLKMMFSSEQRDKLFSKIEYLNNKTDKEEIIKDWTNIYISFIKEFFQKEYYKGCGDEYNEELNTFINKKDDGVKVIWVIVLML